MILPNQENLSKNEQNKFSSLFAKLIHNRTRIPQSLQNCQLCQRRESRLKITHLNLTTMLEEQKKVVKQVLFSLQKSDQWDKFIKQYAQDRQATTKWQKGIEEWQKGMEGKVDAIQKDVGELKKQATTFNAELTEIRKNIAGLETTLKKKFDEVKMEVSKLKGMLSKMNEMMEIIYRFLFYLYEEIQRLQTEVQSLKVKQGETSKNVDTVMKNANLPISLTNELTFQLMSIMHKQIQDALQIVNLLVGFFYKNGQNKQSHEFKAKLRQIFLNRACNEDKLLQFFFMQIKEHFQEMSFSQLNYLYEGRSHQFHEVIQESFEKSQAQQQTMIDFLHITYYSFIYNDFLKANFTKGKA